MKITVVKGIIADGVILTFSIGGQTQTVKFSYTELEDIMNMEDIATVIKTPLGIWKADCKVELVN